jgi:hypothetical protein
MRMLKKGGAPRDRRIDRRKVAMAAAAVLFLFATAAQAQVIDFQIDHTRSYLSRQGSGFQPTDPAGNPVGPLLLTTAQNPALNNGPHIPAGSITAPVNGNLYAAVIPGAALQFFSGSLLGQPNPDPAANSKVTGPLNMQIDTTGSYQPGRDNAGNLPQVSPGPQPGNYGTVLAAVAAVSRDSEWALDAPLSLDPSFSFPSAIATDGLGNFDAHGVVLFLNKGTEDIVSGLASPSKNNVGSTTPIPVDYNNGPSGVGGFQPAGTVLGNIDPTTFHLVLPVNEVAYSNVVVGGTLLGYLVSAISGTIVADPKVPEPSTMVLLAFGVVGLLSYAWRTRKRKASLA